MDLMHWQTLRERVARSEYLIIVNSGCIELAHRELKWLGFHLKGNHSK